ncbi:MAG TPA: universal stress protein, partial [Nitrosopumilaceae archaeon]|nr:universal stress protein [Nitrosopumilaceae archaeon]
IKCLDMAIFLARQCHATITGIYSHYDPSSSSISSISDITKAPKEAGEFMEMAKKRAAENGIEFKYVIIAGEPGYNIIKLAHGKGKFDLIVIGSGKGIARKFFFGSVSNHILHKSKIPVLVIK